MKLSFIPLFLSFFIFASCDKANDNKLKNEQACNNLPDGFALNNFSNGCEDFSKNILGANSTVFISIGDGFCTGTVVAPHFIITASHCVFNEETRVKMLPSDLEIILGQNSFDVFNIKSLKVKNIYANNIYQNPSFKSSSLGDIALIKTEDNLVDNYSLTPAKIILANPSPTENILSIGYGLTGKFNKESGGLKRWTLSNVSSLKINMTNLLLFNLNKIYKKESENDYVSLNYDSQEAKDTFLVTIQKSQSQGNTCYGDSGGPQFVIRNGEAVLISATQGINALWQGDEVSDSIKNNKDSCKYEKRLNTRIAPYVDWLNNIMKTSGESLVLINK